VSFHRTNTNNLKRVARRACYQTFLPGREISPDKVQALWQHIAAVRTLQLKELAPRKVEQGVLLAL
jgi:hypothetical protein